jgi:hypothetical protein
MLHQVEKGLEDLGGKGDRVASAEKQTLVRFQAEVSELVNVWASRAHGESVDLQIFSETFRTILRTLQTQRKRMSGVARRESGDNSVAEERNV